MVTVNNLVYSPYSGRVSVHLSGRPWDWNIGGDAKEDVLERVGAMALNLGLDNIYAPRPSTFNAQICDVEQLTELIDRYPTACSHSVTIRRGCDADGVEIPPKAAFWISSADCITIITHDPGTGKTIAAHGGRDSLVDRTRIMAGKAREFESVVDAIAARYSNNALKRLRVFLTCGIFPEKFDHPCNHPEHGTKNRRMVLDVLAKWGPTCVVGDHFQGCLCLSEIIRAQFLRHGVKAHHIAHDGVDTYGDLDSDGQPRWWSHRRGDGKKRNGVLVVRNW